MPLKRHVSPADRLEKLDLRTLVDEVLEGTRTLLPVGMMIERVDRLSTGTMMGHSTQLFRMFSNLVSNAIQAMNGQERGTLTITLEQVSQPDLVPLRKRSSSPYFRVMVQDNGSGISDELCQQIFTPYFTTVKTRKEWG